MVNQSIVIIYEKYLENMCEAASDEARHLSGLSRMFTGKRSKTEELLPEFDAEVETELNRQFERQSSSAEVREQADWMLDQVSANRNEPRLKYALMAVQRHLIPLISCLSREDAAFLAQKFEAVIPRRERFPVQKELIKKLHEQSRI